jgi:putative flippase GtrA
MTMPASPAASRLIRFAAVGLAAMAAYAVVATLLSLAGVRPHWLGSGLAYAAAAVWSYIGHRRFSFRSDAPHASAGPRFIVMTALLQGLAVAIPAAITDVAGYPAHVSTIAVCIVCPIASFILNSRFVFPDAASAREAS